MLTLRHLSLLIFLLAICHTTVLAEPEIEVDSEQATQDVPTEQDEDLPALPTVTVYGQPEDPLTVSNALDQSTIEKLPRRDGSINEAISILPGILLSEEHRTSDNAGEITPPSLSISGGRYYENNFSIDGIGDNSLLDPTSSAIDASNDTAGHPQETFLHPSLIDQVTVYRSNIPARYGRFTGGVVEIETRDPGEAVSGTASIRHTRSEWTSIHRDRERKEEYQRPYDGSVQPEFRKYDGSASFDLPLNERMGFLAGYSQIYSKIPLLLVDQTENQYRTIENYFLKYVAHPTPDTKWSLSGSYSPIEAKYFRDEVLNSRYTLDNDAYSLTSNLEHRIGRFAIEFDLGYKQSSNSREAPDNYFNWQVTPSKPWGAITDADKTFQYSKEGGYGDLDKEQESVSLSLHVSIDPLRAAATWHNLGFGVGYEEVEGRFERSRDMSNHILASKNEDVICADGDIDCIAGEQFMRYKQFFPAEDTDTRIRFFDAYFEDQITLGQLTLRPGLRVSHDDLQDNTNWAQRLAAGFDLFGDGSTQIFAGFNRYYGKTLLAHALKEKRAPAQIWFRSSRLDDDGFPQPWAKLEPRTISTTRLADLTTPYTDEITVGIDQQLFGGLLNVTYIDRESDDELAATVVDEVDIDGLTFKYSEWTNDGSSSHEEVSTSWERQWRDHYLLLSATWQETETSNSDYDQRADYPDDNDDGIADPVWYRGRLTDRRDLPRPDYNREYSGSMTYIGRLPYGFTFTNITRYRSGYYRLNDTGEDHILPSGETVPVYDKKKQPESWIFDWRLDWEKRVYREQTIIVTLEVNNVFNERVHSGENDDVYELGRQFWLGTTYTF